jgi:hypothetical protein
MHPISLCTLLVCAIGSIPIFAQKLATLEVELTSPMNGLQVPTKVDLDQITLLHDSVLSLMEVQGAKRIAVPYQIDNKEIRMLYWLVNAQNGKEKKRVYEIVKGNPVKAPPLIQAKLSDGALLMKTESKNLLQYNFKTVYPPTGIDTAYKRSAFIHPLWTPNGKVITRIQAPDHYHHYGIWNPWTHVLFEGDTVDFWNIKGRKGTVRFGSFV